MRILFIGGTRFIGRTLASLAVAGGHDVTLFNRGAQDPGGVPGAAGIRGDREKDLDRLSGGRWDAVVDTCGYLPGLVRLSVNALRELAPHYTFISSISIFDHTRPEGADENGAIKTVPDADIGTFSMEHYGALKARCEQVVRDGFPGRALIVRPGLVIGPGDYSDRFTYWVVRIARGGPIAVPERLDAPVQWIDVRDLAAWMLASIEAGLAGDFNATGPETPLPFGDALARIARAVAANPEFVPITRAILEREKIEPWSDMPLALPWDGSEDGMARSRVAKAVAHGLQFRPIEESARDVLAWWRGLEPARVLRAGLDTAREARLLIAVSGPHE
jgi:2'-hydroxyisoflavone reductase